MKRRLVYLGLSITCFTACFLIVRFLSDNQFIRGFIGDLIIILLIYFSIKVFKDFDSLTLAAFTLVLAFATEFLQYLKIAAIFGLEHNRVIQLVLGSIYDYRDLIAYTIGAILVYIIDIKLVKALL